jgi:hypothetical protein
LHSKKIRHAGTDAMVIFAEKLGDKIGDFESFDSVYQKIHIMKCIYVKVQVDNLSLQNIGEIRPNIVFITLTPS